MNKKEVLHISIDRLFDHIRGRRDETIIISKKLYRDIMRMDYKDYEILKNELDLRNIELRWLDE